PTEGLQSPTVAFSPVHWQVACCAEAHLCSCPHPTHSCSHPFPPARAHEAQAAWHQ
ncbi:unnamed protein product, partial [Closterium sp. Naga37s-1]